jgi:hypothetical protein
MKKIVTLAAVAFVGMCGGAMAKAVTVQLDSFCDEYTLTNTGALYAIFGVNSTCDPGIGGGTRGTVKGSGKLITTGMILNGTSSEQYVWTFTSPLATGGTAILYYTTDGITLNYLTQSTFTIVGPSHRNVNRPPATQAARN